MIKVEKDPKLSNIQTVNSLEINETRYPSFNFLFLFFFILLACSGFGNLGCSLLAYMVRILPNISFLVIMTLQ